MNLNDPDPHTGYPMGSYRQDPTGRYQPIQVDDTVEDEMIILLGQSLWLGIVALILLVWYLLH